MVLEIAIGLIFVYLLFSLICSALSEIVAWALNLRARTLRSGIDTLLNDTACAKLVQANTRIKATFDKALAAGKQEVQNVAGAIYAHPLVQGMTHGNQLPSYIPKHIFSAAFLDLLQCVTKQAEDGPPGSPQKDPMQKLRAAIGSLPAESEIRQQLEAVLDETVTDVRDARARVEKWFDDSMERVSGWYKRRAQTVVLAIAIVVVGIANADSVMIVRSLAHDSPLRASLVAAAEQYTRTGAPETRTNPDVKAAADQLEQLQQQINTLRLPIGWVTEAEAKELGNPKDVRLVPGPFKEWMGKLVGLLFTIFAVSMGAPFWFDVLNKVVNARITGAQPPETVSKKDRKKARKQQA